MKRCSEFCRAVTHRRYRDSRGRFGAALDRWLAGLIVAVTHLMRGVFTVHGMMKHVYGLQNPLQDVDVQRMMPILPYRLIHFDPRLASAQYTLRVCSCKNGVFIFHVKTPNSKRVFTFESRDEGDSVVLLPVQKARPKRVTFAMDETLLSMDRV